MATQQVLFVRCGKTDEKYPWQFFHLGPQADPAPDPVRLVYFDYPKGKRKTWNRWIPKRGSAPSAAPDEEVELAPKVTIHDDDGTPDTTRQYPSVLALYDYIKDQPPASIQSLQLFGHGDYDGPILWAESFEVSSAPNFKQDFTLDRDPNDTEPRRRDFFGRNPLAGAEGLKAARAFASDAQIKLWGCTEDSSYRRILHNYQRAPRGPRGDDQRQAHLKDYLDFLANTFALIMARAFDRTVWAAPLGWGTDYNPSPPKPYKGTFPPNLQRERWWSIPRFVGADREFYTRILGARLDATGYVGYRRQWYETARATLVTLGPASQVTTPRGLQQQLLDRIAELGVGTG